MNGITTQTPAELWLRQVLAEEVEPLYRALQAGSPGNQSQSFRYEVHIPARCLRAAVALLALIVFSFVFFVR